MPSVMCERPSCHEEAYSKIAYLSKYLCRKHAWELGDFDEKGQLNDKRRNQEANPAV